MDCKARWRDVLQRVAKTANVALVYTYYEVGRMIVEDEQGGKKRATYGKAQLADLSRKLTERFGKGWSVPNLKLMRQLFVVYSNSLNAVYPIADAPLRPPPPAIAGSLRTAIRCM